jgi:hypothetical protein
MKTSAFKKQYFKYKTKHSNSGIKIPPLEKHDSHNVEIRLISQGKHYAKYHCIDCDKFVSWLSKRDTNAALSLGLIE